MANEASTSITIENTPTWAVAVVCAGLMIFSIFIERALHLLAKFLRRRKRKSLSQALDKVNAELMLLGFLSLLLTVSEQPIAKICIPKSAGEHFLPCKNTTLPSDIEEEPTCQEKDKISLLSRNAVSQLQVLIFVLALVHVLACGLTVALGMAKMRKWHSWEAETRSMEYLFSNDPRRFRLTRQTSFGMRHLHCWSEYALLLWPVSFVRLFSGSISKSDYFALRHGFITAHISEGSKFDFQKFLARALDSDFEVVVGIRSWIWIFSVLFLFFNANGFYHYFWLPFIPLVMLVIVGTKLQSIITKMCMKSRDLSVVARGTVLVKPNDNLFWFGWPRFLLHLIHFILFQNSFQLAFFTWTWHKFGWRSCFHKETEEIVIRIAMGILAQLLIGYVILPLYVLVTQMGSSMKKAVFTERVVKGLKNWHKVAKRSLVASKSNSTGPSLEPSPSQAVRNSVSSTQETEAAEREIEAAERGIIEEEKAESSNNNKATYDGEISFAWRNFGGQ